MNYLEKVNLWKNYANLEPKLKAELDSLDENGLKEHFAVDLEFGTGGLRGVLGVGTNRMNTYIVNKATLGFGRYLSSLSNAALAKGVAIAHDNRHQSKEFARSSAEVLASLGFRVYLFEELRPTPELSFAVRHFNCIGGIMITASHNPKEYNGYKIYDHTGCQLVPEMADKVIKEINAIDDYFNIETSKNHELITYIGREVDEIYMEEVKKIVLRPDLPKNVKFVYTPLHGTGQVFAPEVLKSLGYDVYPLACQMTNDPDFSGVKSSNPENAEAYDEGIEYAKEIGAKIVLATDPDADRLGIAVEHNGEYVLLTGNQTGAILLDYLGKFKQRTKTSMVYNTIVTSNFAKAICEKYNLELVQTLTGFKFIGEQAALIEGTDKEFFFGYEESYGYVIKDFVRDKDSFQATLLLAEVASYYKTQNKTLIDVLYDLFDEFGYYLEGVHNISLVGVEGSKRIQKIMKHFQDATITTIANKPIVTFEDYDKSIKVENGVESTLTLPKSFVLKYVFDDGGWFVLRPSGTEPKLKIYIAIKEASEEASKALIEQVKKEVLAIIDTVE